jgi:hypothetical protein
MKLLLQFRKLVLHIQEKTYVQLPKSPEDYEISITIDESSQARVALPRVFNYGLSKYLTGKRQPAYKLFS